MTIEATIKHARELFADGDNGPAKEAAFRAARAILLDYTKRQARAQQFEPSGDGDGTMVLSANPTKGRLKELADGAFFRDESGRELAEEEPLPNWRSLLDELEKHARRSGCLSVELGL